MAVIFISPKKRQKLFLLIIVALFLLLVSVVFLLVFLSKPQERNEMFVFNSSKVYIDMNVFDSEQLKNMEPVNPMEKEFSYTVVSKDGKQKTGFITAPSAEEVEKFLKAQNYKVGNIVEVQLGRENPFTPYYTITIPPIKKR
jgi:hypothetical protein